MYVVCKSSRLGCILCNTLHRKFSSNSRRKLLQKYVPKSETKEKKVKVLKTFNNENKLLFGSLVETLPQKRKREQKEPIEINDECNNLSDKHGKLSEAWWWKKSLKPLRVRSEHAATSNKRDGASTSTHVQDTTESENTMVSGSHTSNERSVGSVQRKEQSNVLHKSNLRLPQIMVKNLATFPLHNKNKQFLNTDCTSSILNIPMKEESDFMKAKYREYPSVSRILNATISDASRAALQKWKENMIAELGEEGFQKYQKELLQDGRIFHGTVQRFLSGVPVEEMNIDPAVEGCWHSLETTMKKITTVKVLESHVVHQELLYHGIMDCVAVYRGKLLLIEWKKSNKQKSSIWSTYDAPLQVAAYLGAMNFDSNYKLKVDGGLVVVAYSDGSPAHIHPLEVIQCEKYWRMWLARLRLYWDLLKKQDEMSKLPGISAM